MGQTGLELAKVFYGRDGAIFNADDTRGTFGVGLGNSADSNRYYHWFPRWM